MFLRLVLCFGAALILVGAAAADVPQLINYQGILLDTAGDPVTTPTTVIFAIWNADFDGDSLWSEEQSVTPDDDGRFAVLLGSVAPIPDSAFAGAETYLSVKVNTDPEMTPRQRFASVAYAYRDNDWALVEDVLFTQGEWGLARAGNMFFGDYDSTHVNLGVACTTGTSSYSAKYATVGGGISNTASGGAAMVSGGQYNAASGTASTVSGGESDTASGSHSVVGGGYINKANGEHATVSGGGYNKASGISASVGGGERNIANEWCSKVGGGYFNSASGGAAMVSGGQYNTASGYGATVAGGSDNTAGGLQAAVPGGAFNTAAGNHSFAAGFQAKANHDGTFVWADGTGADLATTGIDQFLARASGGVTFYTNSAMTIGVTVGAGGGAWSSVSNRELKRNIRPVDGGELLEKLAQLEISRWTYKTQDENIEHIGPMAQDFNRLFGVGDDDKTISTLDPDGIALAAIQELYEKTQRIEKLETQVAELQAVVQKLLADQQ